MLDLQRFADICGLEKKPRRLYQISLAFSHYCRERGWKSLPCGRGDFPQIRVFHRNAKIMEYSAPTYDECFVMLTILLHSNLVASGRCQVLRFPSGEAA